MVQWQQVVSYQEAWYVQMAWCHQMSYCQDKHTRTKWCLIATSKSRRSWDGRKMTRQCIPNFWCDRRKRSRGCHDHIFLNYIHLWTLTLLCKMLYSVYSYSFLVIINFDHNRDHDYDQDRDLDYDHNILVNDVYLPIVQDMLYTIFIFISYHDWSWSWYWS